MCGPTFFLPTLSWPWPVGSVLRLLPHYIGRATVSGWHLQHCVTIILVIIPAISTRTAVNGKGILRAARADGWHRAHMGVVAPPGGVQHTKC